jgi:hypothetical protein
MLGLKRNNSGADFEAIVREIAERCASLALSHFSNAADRMGAAQLRGYARALVWPQVCAAVHEAEADGRIPTTQTNELVARALEQTVHLVTDAHKSAPIIAMPAPHIGYRAAA